MQDNPYEFYCSDGTALHVHSWGTDTPTWILLCVQGLGGHGAYYQSLADDLADLNPLVIAPDLRGHGYSDGVKGDIHSFGVYIRDLKDILQVFCLINIYLMPVIYLPGWLPTWAQWLIYLNPFSYQTLCFQDVIYHGTITHYWVWGVYGLLSFFALGMGYRLFAKLRTSIGNVL